MLSILCVGLTITVKVGIPESFKVGWYPTKKTGSSHLNKTPKVVSVGCVGLWKHNGVPSDLEKLGKPERCVML